MAGRSVVDRETRSSILPVRTRCRFSSVAERGPPKSDVDCSIQSAGANVFFPLAGPQRATVVLRYEFAPFVRDIRIIRRSWKADVRGVPAVPHHQRRKMTLALTPPKPNPFEIACSIVMRLASRETRST